MTVLVEYYRSFAVIFCKCKNIAINVCTFYTFPIMPALCLMLSVTHYAQYCVGIVYRLVRISQYNNYYKEGNKTCINCHGSIFYIDNRTGTTYVIQK